MNDWLRGRAKALLAFAAIAALVAGGLGWVTTETLRLEEAQVQADFERDLSAQLGSVLWALDSRVAPALAREDSRSYDHYGAFFAPTLLFHNDGTPLPPGEVVEPSPLVNDKLPKWMRLHFQTDAELGWNSPQVLSQNLRRILQSPRVKAPLDNVTEDRGRLLIELAGCWGPQVLMDNIEMRCAQLRPSQGTTLVLGVPPPGVNPPAQQEAANNDPTSQQSSQTRNYQPNPKNGYNNDLEQQARSQNVDRIKKEAQANKVQTADADVAWGNIKRNGEGWFVHGKARPGATQKAEVNLGPMVPLWLTPEGQEERLVVARLVKIGDRQVCQGIVLDWPELQKVLAEEVRGLELFPEARFVPMRAAVPPRPERTMKWLPVELDPGADGRAIGAAVDAAALRPDTGVGRRPRGAAGGRPRRRVAAGAVGAARPLRLRSDARAAHAVDDAAPLPGHADRRHGRGGRAKGRVPADAARRDGTAAPIGGQRPRLLAAGTAAAAPGTGHGSPRAAAGTGERGLAGAVPLGGEGTGDRRRTAAERAIDD